MRLTLNGEHREVRDGATVADLVVELELTRRRIAVEVNRDIVPREVFPERTLCDGDVVEIVQFIGGG